MDFGSSLENDSGHIQDFVSIGLDRTMYKYNTYHFCLKSLGNKPYKFAKDSLARRDKTRSIAGFGGYNPTIRTQPISTNLLSSNDTTQNTIPAIDLPFLDWDF